MLMQIYLYSQFNHLDFLLYLNSVYYGCGESLKACPVTYRPFLISVIDTESNESHCGVLCNTHLVFNLVVWATATRGMYESSSPLYFFLSFTSSCTLNYNLAAIRRENQTKTRNLNKIRYLTTQIKDLVVDTTVIDYNIYRI